VSYIILSIPIFFFLIGIELLISYLKKSNLYRVVVNSSSGDDVIFSGNIIDSKLTFNKFDDIRNIIQFKFTKIKNIEAGTLSRKYSR
jgi:hypothetical protein